MRRHTLRVLHVSMCTHARLYCRPHPALYLLYCIRKTFSAGASLYGVADLKLLAEHTHKFESRCGLARLPARLRLWLYTAVVVYPKPSTLSARAGAGLPARGCCCTAVVVYPQSPPAPAPPNPHSLSLSQHTSLAMPLSVPPTHSGTPLDLLVGLERFRFGHFWIQMLKT